MTLSPVNRTVSAALLVCSGLLIGLARGQEVSPPPGGLNLEPIDFSNNAPAQADPSSPATTSASPWGFAVFSQDSKLLATVAQPDGEGQKGEVFIWEVADVKIRCQYSQAGRILSAAFSPDGTALAIGPSGPQFGIIIVDTKTGEIQQTLPGPAARTNAIAWSADGKRLALGSTADKSVREWDVAKKKFVKAYENELNAIYAVAYSKDGTLMAAGPPSARERTVLHVLDVVAGKTLKTLAGHKEAIDVAEFSTDGSRVTTGGWDASVRVWDMAKGEVIAELKGHKRGVSTVSLSADGKRAASAGSREFKLWDGEKKEQLADLGGENNGARQVAMAPDGAWLVSITRDGTGHLWEVEKKTQKTTLDRTPKPMETASKEGADEEKPSTPPPSDAPELEAIQSLAYSRDGKWLALAREDGRISIRTAGDGKVHREIEAFSDVASSVTFSSDSQLVAAGSFQKVIKVWKVESGDQVAELSGHTNWVFGIAFSLDNKRLASASYDKTVKVWDIAEAKEIATLTGHSAGVRAVAFLRDGKHLISGGSDRTAIVWNLETQKEVTTLKGHTAAIRDISCSPDGGGVATASEDGTIKLWKTSDWTERAVAKGPDGVMFWCVSYSPQGRTIAGGLFDGTVKLFDPSDGKERTTLRGPTEAVTSVAFAPDTHEIIASSIDKSFRRWQAQKSSNTAAATTSTGESKATELKPAEAVTALNAVTLKVDQVVSSLTFDKPGKLLAVGTGAYRVAGSLQLWDVSKHERKWQSSEYKFGIPGVAFSNNGQQLAIGNFADNFVRLYNVADGEKLKELRGHRSKVHGVAYSPNGKYYATASLDRDIKLWDAATNKEIKTFVGHKDYVFSIEFSPDSKLLLSASADRTARLWDVDTGKETKELAGHGGLVQQATFSRDGSRIATASADGTSRVYEVSTGDYLFTLRGHRNKIESVAFSPSGKLIATGASDRSVRLWDASSGAELLKLSQENTIRAVLFSPDGKLLASGGDDKTVKLWDVASYGPK